MKRYKKLAILAVILVFACAATLVVWRYEEEQEKIRTSNEIVLQISPDTVTALSWTYDEDGLAFHREAGEWLYDEDEAFPVNQEKIAGILSEFEAFAVSFIIEEVTDYSQYGLDAPVCTICLTTEAGEYTLKLGDFSPMDEQRYVDIGDGRVYLVPEDPMDYVESALSNMIAHDDTPGFETVADVRFSGVENYTVVREEESENSYSDADLYYVERNGKLVPLDTDAVKDYLNTITQLDLTDYATYNATEEELASFGLAEPELSVTVNYSYTDAGETVQETFVLHIGQDPEALAEAKAAEEAGETPGSVSKYVRVGDSQIVYQLSNADHLVLSAASYDDLRHREVIWADFDLVTGLDITLEGKTHSLIYGPEDPDEDGSAYVWYYGEEMVSIGAVESGLESLSADSFTDETPQDVEEISLTVHLDHEHFPSVQITLYRYNGSFCLAQVDGQTVSLVERSEVMELVEAVQAIVLN